MIHSVTGPISPHTSVQENKPADGLVGSDFQSVMKSVAGDAAGTLKAAESAALSGITGGASVSQVVNSIMAAEQGLNMAISIRDKIVAAYGEISRMNI